MATVKDSFKQIIRDVLAQQGSSAKYRLATVNTMNDDGTCNVLLDGNSIQANPLVPVVQGQQVAVIFGTNDVVSVVPTRPNTDPIPFEKPPFFTGGFTRISGCQRTINGLQVQDVFSPNLYILDVMSVPTGFVVLDFGSPVGFNNDRDRIGAPFSPDGTRLVFVLYNDTLKQVIIRVLNLGAQLQGSPLLTPNPDNLFTLHAPILIDVNRPSQDPASLAPTGSPTTTIGMVALTDDRTSVFWTEVEVLLPSSTGQPRSQVHYYTLSTAGPFAGQVLPVTSPVVTTFSYQFPATLQMRSLVNLGMGSLRPINTFQNEYLQQIFGGGDIWDPALGSLVATVDSFRNGFGNLAGTQFLGETHTHDNGVQSTEGPASLAIINPSVQGAYVFLRWGGANDAGTTGTIVNGYLLLFQSFRDSGQWVPYLNTPSFQTGFMGIVSISRGFRSVAYLNTISTTVRSNHLNVLYEDIAKQVFVEAQITDDNTIVKIWDPNFPQFKPIVSIKSRSSGLLGFVGTGPLATGSLQKLVTDDSGGGTKFKLDPNGPLKNISPGRPGVQNNFWRPGGVARMVSNS